MKKLIKYIKLPFRFSPEKMQQEAKALSAQWIKHYSERAYEGSWTALPLRSINGALDNIIADAGEQAIFNDTMLMPLCPYLESVAETFKCEKKTIRLLKLEAGAIIKEHKDAELSFESGEARIHVPVMTNSDVRFYLEGERVVMNEGESWYMNFNLNHNVTNAGNTDRIHLVIDCIVNDWLRDLFTTGDWEIKNIIKAPPKHTAAEKSAIIANLLLMNTPQSLIIARQLETAED